MTACATEYPRRGCWAEVVMLTTDTVVKADKTRVKYPVDLYVTTEGRRVKRR